MNKQTLMMKYHPAKKEIEFHRFQNGKEIPIRSDSNLRTRYMNKKGKFVLQDYGNEFFDDIAVAFDGLPEVNIEVITTKMDFEDFVQMIEYYNEEGRCKINATLIAELPDMNQTFSEVVKCGEQAISKLEYHGDQLFQICAKEGNEDVKKSAEIYRRQIKEEIDNIREKIDSLKDNSVNLCFTGVYSAGKSALINAILGYKILPEDIKSETAKMFRISSPQKDESVRICFDISNVYTELEWNEKDNIFEVAKGPYESTELTEIQNTINKIKTDKLLQHEQIKKLLDTINASPLSSAEIDVYFPVALDSDTLQFTIYDTPGTDSNYLAHQQVLMDALEEQRQSILIFVAAPNKTEGSGNNALLQHLKAAEAKSSKTSIDLGRSLFVINWADSVGSDARVTLQHEEIKYKEDEDFSIKLADKKLFFTSAKYAYAARAKQNGVATGEEEGLVIVGKTLLSMKESPMSFCYKQDRCATSEVATKKLLDKCEIALEKASGDDAETLVISSGLYALETEILEYGEKYASAVKAFAIIDSIDKALANLTNQTNSLMDSNQQGIEQIEENIRELRKTIEDAITTEYSKISLSEEQALPKEVREKLKIDSDTLQRQIIGHTKTYIDDEIKGWFFGHGKVKVKDKDKDLVRNKINAVIDDFTKQFFKKRKELLESQRDTFMNHIKETIANNGKISDAAKKLFLDIPAPTVSKPESFRGVEDIYDSHRRTDNFLWMKSEHLDKEGFIRDVEESLTKIARQMSDDYGKDYRQSLETLLMQVKSRFETNLEQYSINMKTLIENKEAMMKLGGKVNEAAESLAECQSALDAVIWKELNK